MRKAALDLLAAIIFLCFTLLAAALVVWLWFAPFNPGAAAPVKAAEAEPCKYELEGFQEKGSCYALEDDFVQALANVPAADPADITRLAQMLWGEARGIPSQTRQAAVLWCVFNRIDNPAFPDTIAEVCTTDQFNGYSPDNPVYPELYDLALDVYSRYWVEHNGYADCGRVLPQEYVFFHGDGKENYFRIEYQHSGDYWDWSLISPYGD